MKSISAFLTLLTFTTNVMAQTGTTVIPNNTMAIGKTGNTNKTIEFNLTKAGAPSNPKIRYSNTYSKLQFSHDGTNFADIGSGGSNNLLTNSGFEQGSNGWTVTNSTGAIETTIVAQGERAQKLSLAAQTGTLLIQNITPTVQTLGQNLEVSCRARTSLPTIQLCGMQGATEAGCISIPSTGSFSNVTVNMPGVSSGTIGVKIKATGSSTGDVYVDDCYVGYSRNIGAVAQPRLIGTVKITGCTALWDSTATSYAEFPVQTGCVYTATGQASAPPTMLPAIRFAGGLPAGDYRLEYEGRVLGSSVANTPSFYQFWDGTNTAREESSVGLSTSANVSNPGISQTISYSSPVSGPVQFSIRAKTASGDSYLFGTTANPGVIKVWYFPNTADQVLGGNGPITPTITKFTTGSGTYTPPSGVKYLKIKMAGGGGGGGGGYGGSGTGGTGGNTTFGTSLLIANGGVGGALGTAQLRAAGGTATLNSPAIGIAYQGGDGSASGNTNAGSFAGCMGGSNAFGGAGSAGGPGTGNIPGAGVPNTGAGGGGGGGGGSAPGSGGGGGAGGYIEATIINPSNTYSYAVGAGGTAGAGTTPGAAGGSGVIIIEENYAPQTVSVVSGGGSGTGNLLSNPGFENGYTTAWTVTNGNGSNETTIIAEGTNAAKIFLAGDIGDLLTQSFTPTVKTQGQNMEASCRVNTTIQGIIQLCALNGTSEIGCTNVPSTGTYAPTTVNFPGVSSGTIGVRIKANGTATGSVYVDDCYVGYARNIGSVSAPAQLMGTVTITGCASNWAVTSTSMSSFPVQTSCSYSTYGQAQAPSTMIPAIKFASLPAGDYRLEYEGTILQNTANKSAFFQFSDGTNTARELSEIGIGSITGGFSTNGISQSISYTAPQSNITFEIKGKTDTAGTAGIFGMTSNPGVIKVWYFPNTSQQAIVGQQQNYDWTAYTPAILGFGSPTNIDFQHKREGSDLLIRGKFTSGTPTAVEARIPFPTGLVSADTSRIPTTQINSTYWRNSNGGGTSNKGGTVLIDPSVTYLMLGDSQGISSVGINPFGKGFGTNVTGAAGDQVGITARIPIQGWGPASAPALVGSVTSNSLGAERIERAVVNCANASSAIVSQSGSWSSGVTNVSAGQCTMSIPAGTFSSTPTCTCAMIGTAVGTTGAIGCSVLNPTTTTIGLERTRNNAFENGNINVICMGPR